MILHGQYVFNLAPFRGWEQRAGNGGTPDETPLQVLETSGVFLSPILVW